MNNLFTDLKKKKLYKFLVTSNEKSLEKYMRRLSKKGIKETQFNNTCLFRINNDKMNNPKINSCLYNAREMDKLAIIKNGYSYVDTETLKETLKNNGIIRMALYDINFNDDPRYKTYKVKLTNPFSMDYIEYLEYGLKHKDEVTFVINGFLYELLSYKFIGGNNNECIAVLKRI